MFKSDHSYGATALDPARGQVRAVTDPTFRKDAKGWGTRRGILRSTGWNHEIFLAGWHTL